MNTANSILFMTSARQAVSYLVGISETADMDHIVGMQDFIMNEATDYQVMSLVMTGEVPDEKFNLEEEETLFDMFRDNILENFSAVKEAHGMDIAKELISEVGPLSSMGIDTATPILSHLYESGVLDVLNEKGRDQIKKGIANIKRGARTQHKNPAIKKGFFG